MTLYWRPDSINEENEVEKQDEETLRKINEAIQNAQMEAASARAAADATDAVRNRAEETSKEAEKTTKEAKERLQEIERDADAAEETRESNEGERKSKEQDRITQETERQDNEAQRQRNEAERQTNETGRRERETLREDNEKNREEYIDGVKAEETERENAEVKRGEDEESRKTAETGRSKAEDGRVKAESDRVDAETLRAQRWSDILIQWDQIKNDLAVFTTHVCAEGEYDPETGVPTVDGKTGVIYITPSPKPEEHDTKYEWLYMEDGVWELIGTTNLTIAQIEEADIDELLGGNQPQSADKFMSLSSLTNFFTKFVEWAKTGLAASIAKKLETAHSFTVNLSSTKSASFDGSSDAEPGVKGTLSVANGGTGSATAADARKSLGIGAIGELNPTGEAGKFLDSSGKFTVPPNDNTTYDVTKVGEPGLAPALSGKATEFLNGSGVFAVPPNDNTTYDVVTSKEAGLAPKYGGTTTKFFRDDGMYAEPSVATDKTNGYMAATDKAKLDTITGGKATDLVLGNGTVSPITGIGKVSSATTADKLTSANHGSATKPIYLVAGVPTECSPYPTIPGLATTTAAGLCPALPTSARAEELFLNDENGWTEPIREV